MQLSVIILNYNVRYFVEFGLAFAHEAQDAELTPIATLMKVLLCSF